MPPLRETRPPAVPAFVRDKLNDILSAGGFRMPDHDEVPGYGGTGGHGKLLEELLGINGGNKDLPDGGAWELKLHSGSGQITLFHQEHTNGMSIREVIANWGVQGQGGRCFRHTVRGDKWSNGPRIKGFRLLPELVVMHRDCGEVVSWDQNRVANHMAQKLRRLLLVHASRPSGGAGGEWVTCKHADLWWEPNVTKIPDLVASGVLLVDFDACIRPDGTIRNHGTKFRVSPQSIDALYGRHERFA